MDDDDFEALLAQRLKQHDEPVDPGLAARSMRRARALRRRRQTVAAALAVTVVVGAAWGTARMSAAPRTTMPAAPSSSVIAPTLIGHSSATADAQDTLAPLDPSAAASSTAPPCTARTARWSLATVTTDGTQTAWRVSIQSLGHDCTLDGYPGVQLLDRDGTTVGSAGQHSGPDPVKVLVTTTHAASFDMRVDNSMLAAPSCRRTTVVTVEILAPHDTLPMTTPVSATTCANSSVHPFTVDAFVQH